MCKYCRLGKDGTSDDTAWKMAEKKINGIEIYSAFLWADTKKMAFYSDLIKEPKCIEIKYCPMCGRNLWEAADDKK